MFSIVIKEITSIMDRRFLTVVFFPSLLFWGIFIALVIAENGDLSMVANTWNEQEDAIKLLQIIIFLGWVTFFASILASRLTAILRLYEGYWNFPFGRYLQAIGRDKHKKRQKKIADEMEKDKNRYEDIYRYYPLPTQPEEVMPTLLGNILKNAELYPMDRYKIDAVLIWPRLYTLLPDRFVRTMSETKSAMDFMLVISFLSGSFAFLCSVYLIMVKATLWLILVCFLSGSIVSWIAYQGALGDTLLYAQQIKVAFDLYRNDLLKQMHIPLPLNVSDEKELWGKICKFLYRNVREKLELWYTDDTDVNSPINQKEVDK